MGALETPATELITNNHRNMIIITNKGLIDPLAFELMGASTKRNDTSTIGYFGSGVKYAIAGLLRAGIPFQLWRGEEEIEFTTEPVKMRDQEFHRIHINGTATSLTIDMGPRWEKWMLLRELYANAIDEGGEMAVTNNYQQFITPDRTTIIFPDTAPLKEVMDRQDHYFTRDREVVYEDERIRLYEEIGDGSFYVKGILVGGGRGPGFGYQLLSEPYQLNEERQLSQAYMAIQNTVQAIFKIENEKFIRKWVARAKTENSTERWLVDNCQYLSVYALPKAWESIMLFPKGSEKYATEWNHLVLPEQLYLRIQHPNKWHNRKWTPYGTPDQNAKLEQAMRLVERELSMGHQHRVAFGVSESTTIGMGEQDGIMYYTHSLSAEPIHTIAAAITSMLNNSDGESATKIMSKYYAERLQRAA